MDTRTKYVLPPVVADDSPAKTNPSYSSITLASTWVRSGDYTDIIFERSTWEVSGIAKITINRPEKRNAFRPQTVKELIHALDVARDDPSIGVVILTGKGDWAFCSGGDQMIRGDDGYIGDDAMCSICKLQSEEFQNQLLQWLLDIQLVVDTCCMSYVI